MADASTFITTLSRTTSLPLFFFFFFLCFCCFLEPTNAEFSPSHHPAGLPISSISAAPSFLPGAPEPSVQPPAAALSPDVLPVFPSPRLGGGGGTPVTIPASRSPPNPDNMVPDVLSLPPLGSSATAAATTGESTSSADASDGTIVMFGMAFLWIYLLAGNCRWWF